jgi:hypothetical protein
MSAENTESQPVPAYVYLRNLLVEVSAGHVIVDSFDNRIVVCNEDFYMSGGHPNADKPPQEGANLSVLVGETNADITELVRQENIPFPTKLYDCFDINPEGVYYVTSRGSLRLETSLIDSVPGTITSPEITQRPVTGMYVDRDVRADMASNLRIHISIFYEKPDRSPESVQSRPDEGSGFMFGL